MAKLPATPIVPAPASEGTEKELDFLCVKSMLLHRGDDDDHKYFNTVGIFGVEGVGKTTLAEEIRDKLEGEEETFKPKIWISLSELLTSEEESRKLTLVKRILTEVVAEQRIEEGRRDQIKEDLDKFIKDLKPQQENKKQEQTSKNADPKPVKGILRSSSIKLGVNKSKQPQQEEKKADPGDPILGGLLWALHQKLTGKKYLIVLDGVFNSFDDPWYGILGSRFEKGATATHKWADRLGFGFPKGKGGAVIVTGRSEKAVKNMVGEENCYRLLPLQNIESCWQIYKKAAEEGGIQIQEDGDLIKQSVFEKCEGLPLAAKMMGQIKNKMEKKGSQGNNVPNIHSYQEESAE
ncbi:hypothetical protein Ancab_014916 [Ancistrocladus abbreviatus]